MGANAAERLLQHYVDNFRRLPWRERPGSTSADPYRVWLSEVMLQQTTVAAVAPRFERFVERWPTVEALAAASDGEILGEWAGLGYYARARNLIACAREVAGRGEFPSEEAALRQLPGIGEYTAAAIAAIAFGRRTIGIDTNVARVVARYCGMKEVSHVKAAAQAMIPADRPGDFAQAMMDLGATICRPRDPQCASCPIHEDCVGRASGTPADFPAPKVRRARPQRFGTAWWIERDGCIWLVRRPAKGLLGGMAALPDGDWTNEVIVEPALVTIRHAFTHFALELRIAARHEPVGDGWWQPLETIGEAGLPTLYRRAVEAVLGSRTKLAA